MRILFLGDTVGRTGREAAAAALPGLRTALKLDLAIVNAENASHGFGLAPDMARALFDAGADVITLGNHAWDRREIIPYIAETPRLIRPLNFPPGTPGAGSVLVALPDGRNALVLNVMGRLFMDALDCPFRGTAEALSRYRLGGTVAAIVIDMHAEATSEKMAFAHSFDGQVSLVVGTHTHCPSADHQVLPGGTAFMSDAGMCGDYDSVIGMMVALLLYCYATGTRSARKIMRRCHVDVACRVIVGQDIPDFRTISDFRKIHLARLEALFVEVLKLCAQVGLARVGTIALDGTKVKANASRHKAMSYDRMKAGEGRLKAEIARLLAEAKAADEAEDVEHGPDRRGDELPEELARREGRLAKIQAARKLREERARAEATEEAARRQAEDKAPTKVPPAEAVPGPKDQINFTDPESRIMKASNKGWDSAATPRRWRTSIRSSWRLT